MFLPSKKMFFLCFFGLSLSSYTQAADVKVYPGSNCHYGALTSSSSVRYDSSGFIYNSSTTNAAFISCPIIKDHAFSTSGLSVVQVRYRKASSAGINCQIHARTSGGTSGTQRSQWDFSVGGSNVRTMDLGSIPSYRSGVYTLTCILPASNSPLNNANNRTGVFSYLIYER